MKHIIFTTLLLVFGFSLNAQNTSNPIGFRTERSELVVEGKVINCRSFWNESHTQILTSNLVEVFKVFKGKDFNKETIEIITLGGTVGDRFSIVSHQKTFKPGMEGVFFCSANRKLSSMSPSDLYDSPVNGAASGKIKVENNLNGTTSDAPINIIFSVTNIREPDTAYRISFINQNGIGGYSFEMSYQLELEGAEPCIKKAVETWRCLTNVNWSFIDSAFVNTQFSSDDGKCMVFIGDTIPPDSSGSNFLMRTYLAGYRKICNTGAQEVYYIDNMDVEVNPYYTFSYDCADIDTVGVVSDFFSILLHELGHCHMLGHNIEEDEVMYTFENPSVDMPDFNDILGGKDVIEFSLGWQATGSCSSILIHDTVSCKTNFVNDYDGNKYSLSIYPNPFYDDINIEIGSTTLPKLLIDVIDLTGRSIFSRGINNVEQVGQPVIINLTKEIPPGPYIIRITTKNNSFSTIIIKG